MANSKSFLTCFFKKYPESKISVQSFYEQFAKLSDSEFDELIKLSKFTKSV